MRICKPSAYARKWAPLSIATFSSPFPNVPCCVWQQRKCSAQQPDCLFDVARIHVSIAQQHFVTVAAELADGLEGHAKLAKLCRKLLVARRLAGRQYEVEAALLPAGADSRTSFPQGSQQAISLAGVVAADAPQVTL